MAQGSTTRRSAWRWVARLSTTALPLLLLAMSSPAVAQDAAAEAGQDFREIIDASPPIPAELQLGGTINRQQKRSEVLREEGALQQNILRLIQTEANILKQLQEDPDGSLQRRAARLQRWSYLPGGVAVEDPALLAEPAVAANLTLRDLSAVFDSTSCICMDASVHWIGHDDQATEAILSWPRLGVPPLTVTTGDEVGACQLRVLGDIAYAQDESYQVMDSRHVSRGAVQIDCKVGQTPTRTLTLGQGVR